MRGVQGRQQFSPQFPLWFCMVALALSPAGKAADLFADLQALDQLQVELFSRLQEEHRSAEHPEVAKLAKHYQELIHHYIDDPKAHAARAAFLMSIGQFEQAKQSWESAHGLEPTNPQTVHQLAECSLGLRDISSGLHWLEKAVELDPLNALFHYNLGNAYFLFRTKVSRTKGQSEEAILSQALEHLHQSTVLAPQNAEFARGYAETFYGMPTPDWARAITAWEHYSHVSGDKELAAGHLARGQLRLGRFSKAREALADLKEGSNLKELLESKITAAEQARKPKKPSGTPN